MSAPMDAALLGMIAALLAAVLASVFDQRRESAKTRDTIQDLSTQVVTLTTTSIAHGQQLTGIQEQLGRINASLGNARERLARIEGHLSIPASDPDEPEAAA